MRVKNHLLSVFLLIYFDIADCRTNARPTVSGVRVENEVDAPGHIGYGESGEILVEPEVPVDVVIFGEGLDDVEYIAFTDSVCLTSELNVTSEEFFIHKDARIVFKHIFVEWPTPWRICLKSRIHGLIQIDDDRTWIQTARQTHETYLPIWIQISIMLFLFLLSSLCSGLTLGLMSLTPQELKILMNCGSETEAKYAKAIYPVRIKGNQLLCTVIIVNVLVNAAITLLFDDMTQGIIAFVSSTSGIVIFGEILPQSLCVKYGLAIGAHTIYITRFFMFITSILTYPLGKILDKYAGEEINTVDRGRLVESLKMNVEQGVCDMDLSILKIAIGAMELRKKVVKDVMTPIEKAFMLSEDEILDAELMSKICHSGHTRIPVYEGNNRNKVNRLLYVADLSLIRKDNNIPVKAVAGFNKRILRIVDENMPLLTLMEEFKMGNYHLAMVAKSSSSNHEPQRVGIGGFVATKIDSFFINGLKIVEGTADLLPSADEPVTLTGLITLEDITEELLQAEITDETDCNMSDENQKNRRANLSRKRIAQLLCSEKKSEKLSLQMLKMTIKLLRDRNLLFEDSFMDGYALETLIQKNIREIPIPPPEDRSAPTTVKLYENDVLSNRFIILLEGQADIIFKEKQSSFKVGPWTCFGEPILTAVKKCLLEGSAEPSAGFYFKPDYDLVIDNRCRFLQITFQSLLQAINLTRLIREMREKRASRTREENSLPELRNIYRMPTNETSLPARNRSSTSVIGSLIIPPTHLTARIASAEELNPLL